MAQQIKVNIRKPNGAGRNVDSDKSDAQKTAEWFSRFAALNKLRLRDLNDGSGSSSFFKYKKDDIAEYLKNPEKNEKQIRDAVIYMYGASAHFWRIVNYFASLSDLSYYLLPCKLDLAKMTADKLRKNHLKAAGYLNSMDIKTQCRNMLTVAMREDVGYYTTWETNDNITFQQLPSDYCKIASVEGNVPNVSFDFAYFSGSKQKLLEFYPQEFTTKYNLYQKDTRGFKWQDLDSPKSFAIKCNSDILSYALPPLAGILLNLYDLADYQALKLTKTELENYALLVMKLGMTNGEWDMDFGKAMEFWSNLDGVLPDQVGSVLSPMQIEKIGFDRSGSTGDLDTVVKSEQGIYSAAGVSSLLFNNEKASGNALSQSIKADQAVTFGVVKSIEAAINRLLQDKPFGKMFRVSFLDCSPYNRKELSEQFFKGMNYGMPISLYASAVGFEPSDIENLNYLEGDVLQTKDKLTPLQSGNTVGAMPANAEDTEAKKGRPTNESKGEVSEGTYEPEE